MTYNLMAAGKRLLQDQHRLPRFNSVGVGRDDRMMSNLLWMSPLWGWALPAAVLLPAMAHWLSQRGGTLAVFPSVRFIRMAAAANRRWRRLRDWLLFFLRLMILALIVGAFAQPVWLRAQQSLTTVHDAKPVVLIVDASASMQRTVQGLTLFERAKAEAIQGLQSLDPSRDRAMVIVLDGKPQPTLPRMSGNFSLLIERLQAMQPTWQAGDLPSALQMAIAPQLDPADHINLADLEIHLYSDMQKSQWPMQEKLDALLHGKKLALHPQGPATGAANMALAKPMLWPSQVIVGQPAEARVEVVNHAANARTTQVVMTVEAGGGAAARSQVREVTLGPQGRTQVSFPLAVDSTALTAVRFVIAGDGGAMSADDRTGLYAKPAVARQVVVVTQADVNDPAQASYYLARALSPAAAGSDMAVQVWSPAQLSVQLPRSSPACVVMIQTSAMSQVALQSLQHYIDAGGAVWWIIDSDASAQSLLSWHDPSNQAVSPVRLGAGMSQTQAWQAGQRIALQAARFDDPMLRVFEGPARQQLLEAQFTGYLRGQLAGDAQGLLMFAGDTPALATRWMGQGRLAVWTASWSPGGSDWVRQPMFLPMVQQVVRTLAPGPVPQGNPSPGVSPMLELPGEPAETTAGALQLQQPDGRLMPLPAAQEVSGQWLVQLPALAEPGGYEVQRGHPARPVAGVQVDVDPSEGDLTPWQPRLDRDDSIGDPSSDSTVAAATVTEAQTPLREEPVALWPWLVALASILVVTESLVTGSLSSRNNVSADHAAGGVA